MVKPTIHMNGTSGEELVRFYQEAARLISHVRDALMFTCPNGRDYYPQGEEAYDKAHAEHMARVQKILDVQAELEALADYVEEELDRLKPHRLEVET